MTSRTTKIDATAISKTFGASLDRVIAGEMLEITRYGKVVAVLAPPRRRIPDPAVEPLPAVQPDTASPVEPDIVKAAPSAQDRQRRIDELLRRRPNG